MNTLGISQAFANGLSVAAIFIIVSLGLAIIFGIMNVINLAHGELIMVGAYITYLTSTVGGYSFFLAIFAAFIGTGLVGLLIEISVIKRLYGRPLDTLLATFGISIMLQQIFKIIFGSGGKSITAPISNTLVIGNTTIPYYRLFIIIIAVIVLLVTLFIVYKTKLGMQLRATSQNREISESMGVNTSKIDTLTFAFGSGLAGLAGAILSPLRSVTPGMGLEYVIDAFMAIVLGGVGSLTGTALGAFVIGEGNQLFTLFSSETVARLLTFTIIIFIIRYRPEGLFKIERR